jgi:hypothetical protein
MIRTNKVVLSFTVLGLALLTFSCNDTTADEADRIIAKSEKMTMLDNLCGKIGRPNGFVFVTKKVSGNSRVAIISYRFQTAEDFDSVRQFFFEWFDKDGWAYTGRRDEQLLNEDGYFQFKKGHVSVSVEHVTFPFANYSISCSQKAEE